MAFNTGSERMELQDFSDKARYLWEILARNREGFDQLVKINDQTGDINQGWRVNQNELLALAYGLTHPAKDVIRIYCTGYDTDYIQRVSSENNQPRRDPYPFVHIIVKRNASDFLRALPVHQEQMGLTRSLTETPNHIVRIYPSLNQTYPGFYIITNKIYPSFLLNILTLIGHFMPDYRLPDAMLQALAAKQFDTFVQLLEPLAKDYIVNHRRREMIAAVTRFCEQLPDTTRRDLDNRIEAIQNNINSYEEHLRIEYRKLQQEQDVRFRIIALGEYKTQTEEFLPYLLNKLQVQGAIWDGNELQLLFLSPLLYFDSKAVSDLLGSSRSNKLNQTSQRKHLFQNIFVDQKHTLYTYTVSRWRMVSNEIGQGRFNNFNDPGKGIKHPHLQGSLSCYGQYRTPINRLLQERNLVTALEQTIASTNSFNFFDGPALDYLCNYLFSEDRNRPSIEVPEENRWYSVRDYLDSIHCNPVEEVPILMPEEE